MEILVEYTPNPYSNYDYIKAPITRQCPQPSREFHRRAWLLRSRSRSAARLSRSPRGYYKGSIIGFCKIGALIIEKGSGAHCTIIIIRNPPRRAV